MITRRQFLAGAAAACGVAAMPAFGRIGNIEIGVCSKCANFPKIIEYGFDYLEPSVAQAAAFSEAEFENFKSEVLATPVRCECFNSFIRTLRVVGENVDTEALRNYMDAALGRCRQLGGSIVVWGSSGSRNVPPGFSRARAWKQIQAFLRLADEVARPQGIVVAIEPLRTQESNIINTGAEALKLVREVNRPNIRMIIDYYHMREMNEDPEIVWRARKDIVHFHFANPHGRLWPRSPSEDPEYGRFFSLVKKINFHGGISIEAHGGFEKDARASLAFFREELAPSRA
ncbi:MAG: sugar phosphate isomerase/epimerase [Acidobacteriota bacterium]|nr:sugar phosphate isomerase/epimerase [Acidobacteriota bacterium]